MSLFIHGDSCCGNALVRSQAGKGFLGLPHVLIRMNQMVAVQRLVSLDVSSVDTFLMQSLAYETEPRPEC